MEQCKFKVGDVLTHEGWSGHEYNGMREFEVSKIEHGLIWFKGYEDQHGRKENGYIFIKHNKPQHKHAELIKKWADNPSIEIEHRCNGFEWLPSVPIPLWNEDFEYRIKPTPKPDLVIDKFACYVEHSNQIFTYLPEDKIANIRFTVNGETGQIKSVEML